jgi:hypothetical protein
MSENLQRSAVHSEQFSEPEERILGAYRVPVWATLLFIATMLALYFLSQQMMESYGL